MNNKILIIEDDKDYSNILNKILTEAGYKTTVSENIVVALELLKSKEFQLIMIALDLGAISGFQLSELIRIDNRHTPIMILTNSPNDKDETRALELGIDEYVRKSVSFTVLLSRIQHTINHGGGKRAQISTVKSLAENIVIDTFGRDVFKDGKHIAVTTLEYELLLYLMQHKRRALSRDCLLENVWKIDTSMIAASDMRIVDTSIKNIRKKLGLSSIYTIRGVGYKWVE